MSKLRYADTRTAFVDGKRVYLVEVARVQRVLIYLVMGVVLCYLGAIVSLMSPVRMSGWAAMSVFSTLLLAAMVLAICGIVQTVRLATAAGESLTVAVIAGLAMLVPLLGAVVLLLINGRATGLLKSNGVSVGLMGVSTPEMKRLIVGACASCGYDIRGLQHNRCPECGTAIPVLDLFNPVNPCQ